MPGRGIGDRQVEISELVEPHVQGIRYAGLGLLTQNEEYDRDNGFTEDPMIVATINSSLNGFFVMEEEDFSFCSFQEPWVNSKGERVPGIEIFYIENLYYKEGLVHSAISQGNTIPFMAEGGDEDIEEMASLMKNLFAEDLVELIQP